MSGEGSPKIVLVGAGGMSFGPAMVNDIVHTPELAGARLTLHDVNPHRLRRAFQFASKLNAAVGSPVMLEYTTEVEPAFSGADFVLSSAEFGRFEHWAQDCDIPKKYGSTQINGENGGPGAVFHSLRSIHNTLGICRSIERHCPDAFLINLSNPMSRVTLAINRATSVRNVGMCHEMPMGINRLSRRIGIKPSNVAAKASGINHFTFFTEFWDRRTGEDLMPKLRRLFEGRLHGYSPRAVRFARRVDRSFIGSGLVEYNYTPLVAHMVREYGLIPCSVDSHIGEYVDFATSVAAWMPRPLDFHEPAMHIAERAASWAASTRLPLPLNLSGHSSEEVVPIIAGMWTGESRWIMAVNVPNRGYIPNVADGAIVEVGATVDGDGLHPDEMPPLGEPLRAWIATQVELQNLVVDAAIKGDPELALEAIIQDPNSPPDRDSCVAMFNELRALQADKLPF